MFAAIEKGDIAVQLILKDSTQCRVLIENKTDKPLNVKLPDAFAGVPVLAQRGGGGGGGGGGSRSSGSGSKGGGQQSMGGGMGGGGMMGGGMGMMNVPPEKVGQLDVPVVCLEHGKRDPRPQCPLRNQAPGQRHHQAGRPRAVPNAEYGARSTSGPPRRPPGT